MKHVFLVNSHTTFLSSLGTIDYLKIKDEDVVLLFARGYSNSVYPLPFTIVDIDDIYLDAEKAFNTCKRRVRNIYIDRVDAIIDESIKGDFHMYVPNFNNAVVRLFYTSRRCRRISFIQEGAQIHTKAWESGISLNDFFKEVKKIVRFFKPPRLWLSGGYYKSYYLYKQDKMYTYGLDNKIFASLKAEHHIIKWPVPNLELHYDPNAAYFILDGLVKNNMCEQDVLLSNTEKLVEENALPLNYLKFHPNQSSEERQKMISFFEARNLKYEILDQKVPFELVLIIMHGLKVVGMASSLCFFAKQLGHRVICHDDWLYEESELFKKHIDRTGIQLYKNLY